MAHAGDPFIRNQAVFLFRFRVVQACPSALIEFSRRPVANKSLLFGFGNRGFLRAGGLGLVRSSLLFSFDFFINFSRVYGRDLGQVTFRNFFSLKKDIVGDLALFNDSLKSDLLACFYPHGLFGVHGGKCQGSI